MAQNKFSLIIVTLLTLVVSLSEAVTITFPVEELPNESFPPKLDSPQAVIARKITHVNRWESAMTYGWLLDEPFYQNGYLGLSLAYSWSDFNGIQARFLSWQKGLSDYADQFSKTNSSLQFGRSHGPESGYSLGYFHRHLYGKVSFSKTVIIPTTLGAIYEFGMINYGSKGLFFGGAGLNSAWYFSPHMSFNIGLKLLLRQAVDPLSADLRAASAASAEDAFGTTTRVSTMLDLGFQYLF